MGRCFPRALIGFWRWKSTLPVLQPHLTRRELRRAMDGTRNNVLGFKDRLRSNSETVCTYLEVSFRVWMWRMSYHERKKGVVFEIQEKKMKPNLNMRWLLKWLILIATCNQELRLLRRHDSRKKNFSRFRLQTLLGLGSGREANNLE